MPIFPSSKLERLAFNMYPIPPPTYCALALQSLTLHISPDTWALLYLNNSLSKKYLGSTQRDCLSTVSYSLRHRAEGYLK
jgi:hypothetical protein